MQLALSPGKKAYIFGQPIVLLLRKGPLSARRFTNPEARICGTAGTVLLQAETSAAQIRALLHELGRRLQAAVARGDVKTRRRCRPHPPGIGNRPTADIDASYADPHTIHTVVAKMATDYDLAPVWLNTNATAFVPKNATWIALEQLDGLTIQTADTTDRRHRNAPGIKIAAECDKDTRRRRRRW